MITRCRNDKKAQSFRIGNVTNAEFEGYGESTAFAVPAESVVNIHFAATAQVNGPTCRITQNVILWPNDPVVSLQGHAGCV